MKIIVLVCTIELILHLITNLTHDEFIMKIVQILFIHGFVHLRHKYHALKIGLTHR
jgi:hypothetical protein